MPKISVLMPCYRARQTVAEAIESILGQTFHDFEAVIVDDGSDDNTAEEIKKFKDKRIRLIEKKHSGLIPALNTGLAECRGDFIARMDADDISHPKRFSRQVKLLDDKPEIGAAACQVEAFPAEEVTENFSYYLDWQNSLLTPEQIRKNIFVEVPVTHPSVMLRRKLLTLAGGYREAGFPEDQDLWLRLFKMGVKFEKIPQVLFYWRESGSRLTRTDQRYSSQRFLECKIEHLSDTFFKYKRKIVLWGIGPTGKAWAKCLINKGIKPSLFVDLDPRKIGQRPYGVPVIHPDQLQTSKSSLVLITVGAKGARQEVRNCLECMNLKEMEDFIAVQ